MARKTKRRVVEDWLQDWGHLLNYDAFDKEIEASRGNIQKFMKYKKRLNDEKIEAYYKLIKLMSIRKTL